MNVSAKKNESFQGTDLSVALGIGSGDVVSIVGAGGKTTLLNRLAEELESRELKTVVTTTTRFAWPDGPVVQQPERSRVVADVRAAFEKHSRIAVISEKERADKVRGLDAASVEALHHAKLADVILIEADGARGRLIKAHKDTEPVVPVCTTLVIGIVPVDVIGRRVEDDVVHRMDLFTELYDVKEGDVITIKLLREMVLHDCGYGKETPAHARFALLLNRADRGDETVMGALQEAFAEDVSVALDAVMIASARDRKFPVLHVQECSTPASGDWP